VLATTARRRSVPMPELSPAEAARQVVAAQRAGTGVALVFGRERTGLENEELQRCHAAVRIPANPEYSSLNLAAAVQVLAYEWRVASRAAGELPEAAVPASDPGPAADEDDRPATHAEMESFFGHLGGFLDAIDFHKGKAPDVVNQRLRRLFLRARPDPRELRILRGILSDARRLLR
jgi:tRNA (cytidine32/uridine32-2'-O)-methyltransferase